MHLEQERVVALTSKLLYRYPAVPPYDTLDDVGGD
jgi:hypothetical protein